MSKTSRPQYASAKLVVTLRMSRNPWQQVATAITEGQGVAEAVAVLEVVETTAGGVVETTAGGAVEVAAATMSLMRVKAREGTQTDANREGRTSRSPGTWRNSQALARKEKIDKIDRVGD